MTVGCSPWIFTSIVWLPVVGTSVLNSMHLCSRMLPRQSDSSPLDNKVPPMVNSNQAPDLEGIHREIHDIAPEGSNRSYYSHRLGDQDTSRNCQNASHARSMRSLCRRSPNLYSKHRRRGRNLETSQSQSSNRRTQKSTSQV